VIKSAAASRRQRDLTGLKNSNISKKGKRRHRRFAIVAAAAVPLATALVGGSLRADPLLRGTGERRTEPTCRYSVLRVMKPPSLKN
jgi:hypothetical protein